VINTLRQQEDVCYVTTGNGGSGSGAFSPNDDWNVIRRDLLSYDDCEELDEDELEEGFGADTNDFEFWQLTKYGSQNPAAIQIAINPDNYVTSSYNLRDMICEDQDLEAAEITTGMNGYPRGLRGCVLLGGCGKTIEQMRELAEMYGVELVSLHRRDGWQLWESEDGRATSMIMSLSRISTTTICTTGRATRTMPTSCASMPPTWRTRSARTFLQRQTEWKAGSWKRTRCFALLTVIRICCLTMWKRSIAWWTISATIHTTTPWPSIA